MKLSFKFFQFLFLFIVPYHLSLAANIHDSAALIQDSKVFSETMGVSFTLEHKELDIFIDQKKSNDYFIPRIEALGIWPGVNHESLKRSPIIITSLICIYTNAMILNYVYKQTDADDINIHSYLITPDAPTTKHLIFSYKFTRNIYNNMDVNKTNAMNFSNVAQDFQYSDWYNENSARETKSIYQD
ncbi:MAG: hypothetical protein ACD_44C00125G0007 [uncultured bacterium]|nr:MAG: hypothetical protein ACD_44C00125G0007 [uncultured bacterium]